MGIYMTFKTLLRPSEEFIIMDPCFFGYYSPAKLLGVKPIPAPRYKEENWEFHIEDIQKVTTNKTKAILICSPDNPTGSVLNEDKLKEIAEYAHKNDIKVISDEIYDQITYDGHKFKSIASIPGMEERTIILNGLSKTYAMTGWRVGYIIAPDKETYDRLFSIQMSTFLVLNQAMQHASVAALTGPQDSVTEMVKKYEIKRNYVLDRWSEIPNVEVTKPEGAFYLFPDLSAYGKTSIQIAKYILDEAKVAITPGHLFGENGEGHIRNAYAQSMRDLEEGLDRIKIALNKI
jgi:aspartate/methionine/tyrosine aminotransferase